MSAIDFNGNIVIFCRRSNLSYIIFRETSYAVYNVVYELCFTQNF